MSKKTYRILNSLINSIREISPEYDSEGSEYDSLENFLLSVSFSFLYGSFSAEKNNYENLNYNFSSGIKKIIPDNILKEFPFADSFSIPDHFLNTFRKAYQEERSELPAIIHEFFLENLPDGKICGKSRKKTGVFYTPHPVVEYMVDMTLGDRILLALKGMKDALHTCNMESFIEICEEMKHIRIVDPSCGWGIFLLHSYRKLSGFYRTAGKLSGLMIEKEACMPFDAFDMLSEEYVDFTGKIEKLKEIATAGKNPGLIILNNNIFGFDIDEKAVKIARRILLLEAGVPYEKETGINLKIFCKDFVKGFSDIVKHKFDFVLGNPPYFTIGGGGKGKSKTEYHAILSEDPFFSRFFRSQSDIFYYFVAGGIELLKNGGKLSFITPSYWLENEYADLLRESMVKKCEIEEIINFTPVKVFETRRGKPVNTDTCIFRLRRTGILSERKQESVFNAFIPVAGKGSSDSLTYGEFLDTLREAGAKSTADSIHRISVDRNELSGGKWIISPHREIFSLMRKDGKRILPLGNISLNTLNKFPGEFKSFPQERITGVCSIGQGQETGLSEVFLLKMRLPTN